MDIHFQWQTIRSEGDCYKGAYTRIQGCRRDFRISNTNTAVVRIDPRLKAEIYEKPDFQGNKQLIFADQEISCISSIGSVRLVPKTREEQLLAPVYIKNKKTQKMHVTFLPRGVYDSLSLCGYVQAEPESPLRLEKFNDMVQLVLTEEDPAVILSFHDAAGTSTTLNCYSGLRYTNVAMQSLCDITLDPKTTLLITQEEQQIRVMQSVQGFKPLGALVTLETHRQLPIEALAVRALDLSIAGMSQLLLILIVVCVVAVIAVIKARRSLQSEGVSVPTTSGRTPEEHKNLP